MADSNWTYYLLWYKSGDYLKKDKSGFSQRVLRDDVFTCDDEAGINAVIAELNLKPEDVYWLRIPKKKEKDKKDG